MNILSYRLSSSEPSAVLGLTSLDTLSAFDLVREAAANADASFGMRFDENNFLVSNICLFELLSEPCLEVNLL